MKPVMIIFLLLALTACEESAEPRTNGQETCVGRFLGSVSGLVGRNGCDFSNFAGATRLFPQLVGINGQYNSNDSKGIINCSPKEIGEERARARKLILCLILVGGISVYFGNRMLKANKDDFAGRVMLYFGFFCFFLLLGARNLV